MPRSRFEDVVVLGLAAALVWLCSKHQAGEKQKQGEDDVRGDNRDKLVQTSRGLGSKLSPETRDAENQARQKAEESYWRLSKYGAVLGGGAAVFALAIAVMAYLETRKQTGVYDAQLRPWISVSLDKAGPVVILGPYQTSIALKLKLANVGHDPAPDVGVFYDVVAVPVEREQPVVEPAFCRTERDFGPLLAGHLMFPTEVYEPDAKPDYVAPASLKEIARSSKGQDFWIMIVGCATYRWAQDGVSHQTPFVYKLSKVDPTRKFGSLPFRFGDGSISVEDLRLREVFVMGVDAT